MARRTKKNKKIKKTLFLVLFSILASLYLIYSILLFSGIEDTIRYLVVAGIVVLDVFILYRTLLKRKRRLRKPFRVVSSLIVLLYGILSIYLANNMLMIFNKLDDLNKDISKSTSLVTLSSNNVKNVEDIKKSNIGLTNMKEDVQAYDLPKEIINDFKLDKNNEIKEYNQYLNMLDDLLKEEIDYVFLPTNYLDIFRDVDGYDDLDKKTRIVYSKTKNVSKKESNLLSSSKKLTEPFTVLLLGVDTTVDGLKNADAFNGDVIMLVTFNPKTLSATMLSIPRDSYVPIACYPGRTEDKITHAAGYGVKCVIDTVSDFTDIKIDYYMKINFRGIVDLVDALGGITVDVPYAFCEQNSKRQFGSATIYVEKGIQKLDGEQALAFSRNRKSYAKGADDGWVCRSPKYTKGVRSDFQRGDNQQMVIKGMLEQIKHLENINKANSIMDAISRNIDTNMNTKDIFSFYDVIKDIVTRKGKESELFNIQKLGINGSSQMIYNERFGQVLYDYVPNKKSVTAVSNAMKENLGLKPRTLIKEFSYVYGENYKAEVIGKNVSGSNSFALLADFTKMTKEEAEAWAKKSNITIIWEEVETEKVLTGVILSQSEPVSKRLDQIKDRTVTLKIAKNINDEEEEEEKDEEEEEEEDEEVVDPNPPTDPTNPPDPALP